MTMGKMSFIEAMAHAGEYISSTWMEENIRPVAEQAMPHYLFTEGDEKHRMGWCSACERWVDASPARLQSSIIEPEDEEYPPFVPMVTEDWKFRRMFEKGRSLHNRTGYCPDCGARVTFRGMWRGHRSLEDKRFLIRYEKSRIDPKNTVVCIGYRVCTEWREMDPQAPSVPIEIRPQEVCIFKSGEGGERFIWQESWTYGEGWVHRKECKSGYAPGLFGAQVQSVLDNYSFIDTVRGTPFEKPVESGSAIWDTQTAEYYDRISIMGSLAKYPCVEYLFKMGMDDIANDTLKGRIGSRINRKGKTARDVLRLTGDEWGEVKGKKLRLTPDALDVHRMARKMKLRMNMELIDWCGRRRGAAGACRVIFNAWPGYDPVKMLKYCRKKGISLKDYADHVGFMKKLGMTAQDTEFLFPRDFQGCHMELARRIGDLADLDTDLRISLRIEGGEMDEYFFSAAGLTIRPAFSAKEITAEGNALKHCVGGYVKRYAEGETNICFLRDDNAPNKPRYTVEFSKSGVMLQCRGYGNDMGEEARAQKQADAARLALFWRLHEMYRKDLKTMKKKQKAKESRAA